MRKNATWGGNIEIQAMSKLYGINITIHQVDQPRWEVVNHAPTARSIHLRYLSSFYVNGSYHNGDHYSSVRPIGQYRGVPGRVDLRAKPQVSFALFSYVVRELGKQQLNKNLKFHWVLPLNRKR